MTYTIQNTKVSHDLHYTEHISQILYQIHADQSHDLHYTKYTAKSLYPTLADRSHDLHYTKHIGQSLYQTKAGQSHDLRCTKHKPVEVGLNDHTPRFFFKSDIFFFFFFFLLVDYLLASPLYWKHIIYAENVHIAVSRRTKEHKN